MQHSVGQRVHTVARRRTVGPNASLWGCTVGQATDGRRGEDFALSSSSLDINFPSIHWHWETILAILFTRQIRYFLS
jgi:hypothetical protein